MNRRPGEKLCAWKLIMLIFLLINTFKNDDLLLLFNTLAITQVIITENRLRVFGLDALCIFLHCFAYPNRLFGLIKITPEQSKFNTNMSRVRGLW